MVSAVNTTNNNIYALLGTQHAVASAANIAASDASAKTSGASGASTNQVSTYDFTNMTPSEMQGVAQNMYDTGQIDMIQLFHLQNMGVPLAKVGPDGTPVLLTDAERASFASKPYNYIQGAQDMISSLEETGYASDPKSGYQGWKDLLATLQQTQGAVSGVDISA